MIKRIVIKVGTSTLTHDTGLLNLRKIDMLTRVIADIMNAGTQVVLVTSAAIAVGRAKLRPQSPCVEIADKQAAASVGQLELMCIYSRYFSECGVTVGQILLTKDVTDDPERKAHVTNTLEALLGYGMLPIVNANDTVAVDELTFGDNDTLSAYVARLVEAELLVLLTDVDGLLDRSPNLPDARIIPVVERIDDDLRGIAGGIGSSRGTGGMITKVSAAEIAGGAGINTVIVSGHDPRVLYDLAEGKRRGTLFQLADR